MMTSEEMKTLRAYVICSESGSVTKVGLTKLSLAFHLQVRQGIKARLRLEGLLNSDGLVLCLPAASRRCSVSGVGVGMGWGSYNPQQICVTYYTRRRRKQWVVDSI